MSLAETAVVTGAFSYTGRAIAEQLLERGTVVRTLSRTQSSDPRIESSPFAFDDPAALARSLEGAQVLYNTYWVRFPVRGVTFEQAIANSATLFHAARTAGVERIVHVSVSNPSERSPWAYFRGKAAVEHELRTCGLRYGIVRPTLVFGRDDILLNNIAWTLRRFPCFVLPGDGNYGVQPVSVTDVARLCISVAAANEDAIVDAAGPELLTFAELVRIVGRSVGRERRLVPAPWWVVRALGSVAGLVTRDVLLTREEIGALAAGLLVSFEPPRCHERFTEWVGLHGAQLGRAYTSEIARNYR